MAVASVLNTLYCIHKNFVTFEILLEKQKMEETWISHMMVQEIKDWKWFLFQIF